MIIHPNKEEFIRGDEVLIQCIILLEPVRISIVQEIIVSRKICIKRIPAIILTAMMRYLQQLKAIVRLIIKECLYFLYLIQVCIPNVEAR